MLSFSRSSMIQLSSSGKLEADKKGDQGSGWLPSPPRAPSRAAPQTSLPDGQGPSRTH